MRKLVLLFSIFLCCFTIYAQPISIAGITPGKTTRLDLMRLIRDGKFVKIDNYNIYGNFEELVYLNQLDQPVGLFFRNDIVFEIRVSLFDQSLKQTLIEKYGKPRVVGGRVREYDCSNDFQYELSWSQADAIEEDRIVRGEESLNTREEGSLILTGRGVESLQWPVKDGIRAAIRRRMNACPRRASNSSYIPIIWETYILRHVATVEELIRNHDRIIDNEQKEITEERQKRLHQLNKIL